MTSPEAEARASDNLAFCLTTLVACLSGQKPRQKHTAKYLFWESTAGQEEQRKVRMQGREEIKERENEWMKEKVN